MESKSNMKEYIHYQNYYKDTFLPLFEEVTSECQTSGFKEKELCEKFVVLFETSFMLLKYYLQNHGLFQFLEADVFREAFAIELLDDGEEWMQVLKKVNNLQFANPDEVKNKDFLEYLTKHFYIFENLNQTFSHRCKMVK